MSSFVLNAEWLQQTLTLISGVWESISVHFVHRQNVYMTNTKLVANELIINRICVNIFTSKYSFIFNNFLFEIFTPIVLDIEIAEVLIPFPI